MTGKKYETVCENSGKNVSLVPGTSGVHLSCDHSTYRGKFMCADTRDRCVAAPELLAEYRNNRN